MFRKSLATLAMVACGVAALAGTSRAALTSWESATVDTKKTNWTESLTLHKFDSSLGTLTGVYYQLIGNIEGDISYTNLDATPADITGTLQAQLTLTGPSSFNLGPLTISESRSDTALAPNASKSYTNVTATGGPISGSDSNLSYYAASGEAFTVSLKALGQSYASGSGNLESQFRTWAGGTVSIQYEYTPNQTPVPEPTSLALLGLGGVFGLFYRQRRRNAAR